MSDQERIIDLESRIAFQEDAIDKLSDVVSRQEQELLRLEKMVRYLHQQLKSLGDSQMTHPADEPPPPHY